MGPFGHMAAGFAVRAKSNRIPLVVLLVAAYFIEIMYFLFAALGMDTPRYAPWSHSLGMALVWAIAGGGLYALAVKKWRDGLLVASAVFAHWALDILVWDTLPLAPGLSQQIPGVGLYRILGFKFEVAGGNLPTLLVTILDLGLFTLGLAFCIARFRQEKRKRKG
ncbi:MAG: hypothetical protein WCT14_19500 [Treponemataceae bacterium]